MSFRIKSILLIDDNPADNFMHTRVIKKSGLVGSVHAVESGQEALDYLKSIETPPNLIFLDINMPGMNGFEFLVEYNKLSDSLQGDVIVIMLTTSLNPDDHDQAEKEDAVTEFMNKPLTEAALKAVIDKNFD